MESHGGMMSTGENSRSVYQSALWQSYQQSHLIAIREDLGEGNDGFCLRNIPVIPVEVLYVRFTSLGVLRIVIALKKSIASAGFLTCEPWVQWQAH
jgi:hypothetical protein